MSLRILSLCPLMQRYMKVCIFSLLTSYLTSFHKEQMESLRMIGVGIANLSVVFC